MSTLPVTGKSKEQSLQAAVELGKEGMFLDALVHLQACGPLRDWTGSDRTEVAWMVQELGAPRLSRWHILKAYREAPESLAVCNAYGGMVAEENGPLDALEFVEKSRGASQNDPAEERLRWLWLQASSFTQLRDFAAAELILSQMSEIPERPEITLFTRAYWLERQDRYDEALETITEAVKIRNVRSTIGYRAHLLTLLGRDDDAYETLREADAEKQVASFSWQMSGIAYERRDYSDCSRLLERFESLSPLMERAFGERFTMFRSELARRSGDDTAAIQFAKRSKSAYGNKIAERLADPARRNRVDKILPVEFVRQHEMTCGPATLAAISRYWDQPAEHLEVADEICYNGTTAFAERKWANENGYVTREFTVTEPSIETLIGRDIPFTLVTRGAGYAHLQAVIGYDGRTGMVLIRDPFHRVRGAAAADELLEAQTAHGPRGMVLVPQSHADRIEDLELPDAELYDLIHRMDAALIEHDRDEAIRAIVQVESIAPDHRLHWQARRQLATYDASEQGMLRAVQQLRQQYPDDVSLQMSELSLLGNLGRLDERIQTLRELVAKPLPHPLLLLQLAESLALDGRYRDEAHELLRSAIRKGHSYARSYLELGDLLWNRHERERALQLYRYAACLEEKDEFLATRYFDAAVAMGRTEEALKSLRERFEKFGDQSMQPSVTLHQALRRLKRHKESIAVLESAMQRRPEDAELKLAAVQSLMATSGEYWPRAEQLLESVKGSAPERQWREIASEMAVTRGEWQEGLEHLETLLPRSPLSMRLREQISDLILQTEGEAAAIERWRDAAEEFPHYQPLQERYAMALRGRPLEVIQPVLEAILSKTPDNAWAVRELAQHLLHAGKLDEAEKRISRAIELDGENSFAVSLQASLESKRGDNVSARKRLRDLLSKDISDEYLVTKLLDSCDTIEEQQQELAWVLSELRRQPLTGDVLMIYRDYALSIMPAEDLLASLQEAVELRPDLWQAHQAWIRQLTHMQAFQDATEAADRAIEEFPLEPNAWFEKYRVASAIGDAETQRAALERCELLRPSNPAVVRALSDVFCGAGEFDRAREILEQLVARQPLDPITRGYLADVLAELDETEAALEQYEQAVRLEPDYEYAWGRLESMAYSLERPTYRLEVAQKLAEQKPHECGAWIELARSLGVDEQFEAAHEALDRAQEIDPYREAIYTGRARLFLNSGDYASAIAALQPSVFPTIPATLESTRAQILWDVGQQDEAYELIRSAADENPGHLGIWSRLEQWAMNRGDREQAIAAIEHQVQLQPFDADVLDSAGSSFASLEEFDKAKESFRRTIEIAPGYAGSRCHLFDLLTEDGQWDEAREIIRDLPRCDQHPTVVARRMQVSVHDNDLDQAQEDFEAILASDEWSLWAVNHAIDLMTDVGREAVVTQRIEQAVEAADANAELGIVWTNLQLSQSPAPNRATFDEVATRLRVFVQGENPHLGYAAFSAFVPELTKEGRAADLRWFIKQNADWIRQDTHCWTLVAFAYADNPTVIRKKEIRDWIQNWRDRSDYEPWMLTNVHELCRITGDYAGGQEAVQLALSMPPDHMQSQLRLWAAHDALCAGHSQLALKHFMGAARLEHLDGMDRLLHHWVEVVIHAQQAEDKSEAFRQVKQQLAETGVTPKFFATQPVYRRPYERTLQMVAKAVGTPAAKLWAVAKQTRLQLGKIGLS